MTCFGLGKSARGVSNLTAAQWKCKWSLCRRLMAGLTTDAGIVKSKQPKPCALAVSIQPTWGLGPVELRSYSRGCDLCRHIWCIDSGRWARDAQTPVGLRPRLPSCAFERVCAQRCLFYRHYHCRLAGVDQTLTVHTHGHGALYGPGEGTVAGVAFQWSAVVRTQSGKPATEKQRHREERRKKWKRGKRVYQSHKKRSKAPNSEVPAIEVIYGSLSAAWALPLLSKSPAPITQEHLKHYYINKVLNFKYLVRTKRSHNKLLNMVPLVW